MGDAAALDQAEPVPSWSFMSSGQVVVMQRREVFLRLVAGSGGAAIWFGLREGK